jgi:transcriptional regulator with XRE-family HTH domain
MDTSATPAFDAAGLGRAIRDLRKARGWTQSELANWLDVHRTTVAALEHGEPVSTPVALRALSMLGAFVAVTPKATLLAQTDEDEPS